MGAYTSKSWDKQGEKYYETGVSHGLLFVAKSEGATDTEPYESGVIWNGLTQVQETPSGAEANAQYADNIKYLNLYSAEEFGATIEAFTYPDAFGECDGSAAFGDGGLQVGQQSRKSFGLAYETKVGNDQVGADVYYKLHLIYGAMASPSEKAYQTVNDSPEPITFSWEITTTPVPIDPLVAGKELNPTSLIVLDSRKVAKAKMDAIRKKLWGTPATTTEPVTEEIPSRLPMPDEIIKDILANG